MTKAVIVVKSLAKHLTENTAVLIEERGTLQSITQEQDPLMEKIDAVFGNALSRSHTTWKIGMGLTLA